MQIASRFVMSRECPVSDKFKQTFVNTQKDDIVLTSSPVGLPDRAIKNKFVKDMANGKNMTTRKCPHFYLKKCDHRYCINERLNWAGEGNIEDGLIFAGENTFKMKKILSVTEIFEMFKQQAESVYKEGKGFCTT